MAGMFSGGDNWNGVEGRFGQDDEELEGDEDDMDGFGQDKMMPEGGGEPEEVPASVTIQTPRGEEAAAPPTEEETEANLRRMQESAAKMKAADEKKAAGEDNTLLWILGIAAAAALIYFLVIKKK